MRTGWRPPLLVLAIGAAACARAGGESEPAHHSGGGGQSAAAAEGRRSHAFAAVRRPAWLREQLVDEVCATPFVYMYEASYKNEPNFSYPGTRKALSSFPGAAEIDLVEFEDSGKRLGIKVKDRAQGQALVTHVKATMKDEDPRLTCYAPKNTRKIEGKPGEK